MENRLKGMAETSRGPAGCKNKIGAAMMLWQWSATKPGRDDTEVAGDGIMKHVSAR